MELHSFVLTCVVLICAFSLETSTVKTVGRSKTRNSRTTPILLALYVNPATPIERDFMSEEVKIMKDNNQEIVHDSKKIDFDIYSSKGNDSAACSNKMKDIFLPPNTCALDEEFSQKILTESEILVNQSKDESRNNNSEVIASESNATVELEQKRIPDDIPLDKDINLEVGSMQSFEEWKSKKLQEQMEEGQNEEEIKPTLRMKKTQVNYASQDCGAKILAHNEEAKHVFAILDENKDLYMLNPCSASIYFVIELCEPIQVQQLQLCNLELFSSAPKDFAVSISERYPAREWHPIGIFQASNNRSLQTFKLQSAEGMFAKYVKFEMINHFSNEHFCPLTLVRVLGASMVEEYDEAENSNKELVDSNAQQQIVEQTREVEESNDSPLNKMFNIVKNAVDHVLSNGAENSKSVTNDSNEIPQDNETFNPNVESEVVLVTNETEISADLAENRTGQLVTLVETGNGEDISNLVRNGSFRTPHYLPLFHNMLSPFSDKLNVHVCWFVEFFCKVTLVSCIVHYPFNYSSPHTFYGIASYSGTIIDISDRKQFTKHGTSPNGKEPLVKKESSKNIPHVQHGNPNTKATSDIKDTSKLTIPDESASKCENREPPLLEIMDKDKNVVLEDLIQNNEDNPDNPVVHTEPLSNTNAKEVDEVDNNTNSKILQASDIFEAKEQTLSPDILDKQNSPQSEETNVATIENQNNSVASNLTLETESSIGNHSINQNTTTEQQNDTKTIDGSQLQMEDPIVINPGTNQKESVFMRLSNRIRILERNMSLSSAYLETLSQRYKKQMDEMQRAFNQTTSKLLCTSRTADENDAKQTEQIVLAQAKIDMLNAKIENLTLSYDMLHLQFIERHACLILLEIFIFVATFISCVGRRMSKLQLSVEKAESVAHDLENLLGKYKKNDPSIFEKSGVVHRAPKTQNKLTKFESVQPVCKVKNGKHKMPKSKHSLKKRTQYDGSVFHSRARKPGNYCSMTSNTVDASSNVKCKMSSGVEVVGTIDILKRSRNIKQLFCKEQQRNHWNGQHSAMHKLSNGFVKGIK